MRSEAHWQRAALLVRQSRWDMAIQELRALLTNEPEHAHAHALLAIALAQTDELDAALTEARQSVALAPHGDFELRALAVVLWRRGELEAAANAIEQAIAIDPDDVDHRSLLAQIRCSQKRWRDAVEAADQGLALDPHDTDCLNLRTLALTKLGRGREATASAEASLARDPDNPYTHHTRGVALLHQGDANGAAHHFQEALRRDPTLDAARAGLVEALKARNPVYRLVLSWFLWLERFSGQRQFAIIIGLWLAARVGGDALANAGHGGAATVVRYSWLGFVLLTACAVPLFNLLLLLHPLGRHALDRRSRNNAMLLGACMLIALGASLHAWIDGDAYWSNPGWLFWLVFLLPVSGLGLFHSGWARRVLQVFCAAAVAFWIFWVFRAERLATAFDQRSSTVDPLPLREHGALFGHLVLAVVLSTWFVLLAPKGRPPRHAR